MRQTMGKRSVNQAGAKLGLRPRLAVSTMRALALVLLTLSLPAHAAGLDGFAKDVAGRWQRVPVPALAPFGADAVRAALVLCDRPVPHVTYAVTDRVLLRRNEDATVEGVGFAQRGEARNGLLPWIVATNRGEELLARTSQDLDGAAVELMIADGGTWVRCPTSVEAKADEPTDG